jgi:CRP-like cAMP-binding protein
MTQEWVGIGVPLASGIRDRVFQLRALQVFTGLDDDGLTLLAEHARPRAYRAGETVMQEGRPVQALYFVLEGTALLRRAGRAAKASAVARGLGLLEYLAGLPAPEVTAESDARLLEIPAPAFQAALEENFSLARDILRLLGTSLTQKRRSLPADPDNPPEALLGEYYEQPRTLTERMIELRSSPLGFANIEALVDFARCTVEERVEPGHLFWSAGDESSFSIHVNYGRVRCTAPNGETVVVGSDYTLGVMDVWGSARRAYEVRAETPVICYRVGFEEFLNIVETHAQVAANMLSGLSRALLELEAAEGA